MLMERGRRNGSSHILSSGFFDGVVHRPKESETIATIPASSSWSYPSSASSSSSSSSSSSLVGVNYIEHRVSKMDTLAGIAIKYGVEVADIRRLNGLVTDLQMFGHKSLQIPLPGRHPPSPYLSNGSVSNGEQTPPRRSHNDILESFQPLKLKPPLCKVSPAMSSLQGYYGLTPPKRATALEGTEMTVYKTGKACYLEDERLPREAPNSEPLLNGHRKSRSFLNGFLQQNGDITEDKATIEDADGSDIESSVRRRQKADAIPLMHTPDLLSKEESSGGLLGRTGKSRAPRPKTGSRTDIDANHQNFVPIGDSLMSDALLIVRKSSSTSSLQESGGSSSIWPKSRWSLKPDTFARPFFDGLSKPLSVWRNKAARD
ncbi:uncharacterized protein [Typha angustifolia]|uniref:uncharacterized protein n=1 Tax=Typha angustifolia TaxID=59011 RepID=UPI003C2F431E